MATSNDLQDLSDEQLVQAYVENVRFYDTLHHIGHMNRVMRQRIRIADELKARDPTLRPLRGLLTNPDPKLRLCAAIELKSIDREPYDRIVHPLAKRQDRIGWEARDSLFWDAHFQKHSYSQEREDVPRERGPHAWKMEWQANNPPPEALSRAEVERRLFAALPPEHADKLIQLARPAIGLWPQRPRSDLPATASRLGGMPHAPVGWSWPVYETEPLLFLGQINCADLRGLSGSERLPESGLLAFFGDHDAVMGCDFCPEDPVRVYHWPDIDDLRPATPPIEVLQVFPTCEVAFRPFIDLPHADSLKVQEFLPPEFRSAYYALCEATQADGIPEELRGHCSFGKLLGWPWLVQNDLAFDGTLSDPAALRLLLQLDDYSNGEEGQSWGPGGSLYFLMADDDLRARRFDRVEFDGQFT